MRTSLLRSWPGVSCDTLTYAQRDRFTGHVDVAGHPASGTTLAGRAGVVNAPRSRRSRVRIAPGAFQANAGSQAFAHVRDSGSARPVDHVVRRVRHAGDLARERHRLCGRVAAHSVQPLDRGADEDAGPRAGRRAQQQPRNVAGVRRAAVDERAGHLAATDCLPRRTGVVRTDLTLAPGTGYRRAWRRPVILLERRWLADVHQAHASRAGRPQPSERRSRNPGSVAVRRSGANTSAGDTCVRR